MASKLRSARALSSQNRPRVLAAQRLVPLQRAPDESLHANAPICLPPDPRAVPAGHLQAVRSARRRVSEHPPTALPPCEQTIDQQTEPALELATRGGLRQVERLAKELARQPWTQSAV